MNVSKGDKAIVISGAAMGSIVEVGEYIAPRHPFKQANGRWAMVLEHSHWCTSLGGPLKVMTDVGLFTPDLHELGVVSTEQRLESVAPLEDDVLRKLTDVEQESLLKQEVPA
jgi:hypothetical protein